MRAPAFHLQSPVQRTTSVIFASPHSGRAYSDDFLRSAAIAPKLLRSSEDAFVDQIFAPAPACGAPLLLALAPRAYVDLNRAADELDPDLIEGLPRGSHNPRIASGLGVIPRVVAGGRVIREGKISRAEADERINRWWRPYHARLRGLIDESHRQFGEAILVDCHSMPQEVIASRPIAGVPGGMQAARRADVVLGDRFGSSAAPEVMEHLAAAFERAGLTVARNIPFAGAYVTQRYGRPSRRQHVIQIEIDRSLYMDEKRIEPNTNFATFRTLMAGIIAEITEVGRSAAPPIAAE